MKCFRDYLIELADAPYSYEAYNTGSNIFYHFDAKNIGYTAKFVKRSGSKSDYGFSFFDQKSRVNITNMGDAFKVFATIASIFNEFVNEYDPKMIMFMAEEGSRIKLYDRIFGRLQQMYPDYSFFHDEDDQGQMNYTMVKDLKRKTRSY